jgi:hypothetical protein
MDNFFISIGVFEELVANRTYATRSMHESCGIANVI